MSSTKTRYVSMNLHDAQVEKLDDLAKYAGMNRNRFLRWLFDVLSHDDVDSFIRRP